MDKYRTPLSYVKGLGSSSGASDFFVWQRLTAFALIPLTLWLLVALVMLPEITYKDIVAWIKIPFNTVMLISIMLLGFYHAQMGIQVILEDYIAHYSIRLVSVLIIKMISFFMMVSGVISILAIGLKV